MINNAYYMVFGNNQDQRTGNITHVAVFYTCELKIYLYVLCF